MCDDNRFHRLEHNTSHSNTTVGEGLVLAPIFACSTPRTNTFNPSVALFLRLRTHFITYHISSLLLPSTLSRGSLLKGHYTSRCLEPQMIGSESSLTLQKVQTELHSRFCLRLLRGHQHPRCTHGQSTIRLLYHPVVPLLSSTLLGTHPTMSQKPSLTISWSQRTTRTTTRYHRSRSQTPIPSGSKDCRNWTGRVY